MDIRNTLSFNGIHIEGCYMNYYFIEKQREKGAEFLFCVLA